MSGKNTYQLELGKRSLESGTNFMHAQSTVSSIICAAACCSFMFSLIIWYQIKDTVTNINFPQNGHMNFFENYYHHIWAQGICHLIFAGCIGSILVAVARKCVNDHSLGGLKFCCIFDGICSGISACEGLGYCLVFILVLGWWSAMGSLATFCSGAAAEDQNSSFFQMVNNYNGSNGTGNFTENCQTMVEGIRPSMLTMAFYVCIMSICACKAAAACGAGAKYAKDLGEDLEDEEGAFNEYY